MLSMYISFVSVRIRFVASKKFSNFSKNCLLALKKLWKLTMHKILIDDTSTPVRKRRGTVEQCDAMETFDRFSGLPDKFPQTFGESFDHPQIHCNGYLDKNFS